MAMSERVKLLKAAEAIIEYIEGNDVATDPLSDRCDLSADSLYEQLMAFEKYLAVKGQK